MFIFDVKSHNTFNNYWYNSSLAIHVLAPPPHKHTQHNANSCLTTSAIHQQTCSLGLRWVFFSQIYCATAYGKTLPPCLPVKPIPTTGNLPI